MTAKSIWQRILLATEHSEFDVGAERLALAMARHCGLPLYAVLPIITNPEYEAIAPEIAAKTERAAAGKLADLRAAAGAAGVVLEARARRSEEAWQAIVAEASERKADLLVTRRRGKRGFLANLLVGEMVSKVARYAPCSVLMAPRAAQMWSRRVLACVDGSPATERVAAVAAMVARQCSLSLAIVCVLDASTRANAEETLLRASSEAADVAPETKVLDGKPFEAILKHAKDTQADLLVIGRHGETSLNRMLLGGTAQKVIGLAESPVLVVATSAG